MTLQDSCTGNTHNPEFRSDTENATIKSHAGDEGQVDELEEEDDFDAGEVFSAGNGDLPTDSAIFDFMYANTVGTLVQGTLLSEDDANEILVSVDCALIGTYIVV